MHKPPTFLDQIRSIVDKKNGFNSFKTTTTLGAIEKIALGPLINSGFFQAQNALKRDKLAIGVGPLINSGFFQAQNALKRDKLAIGVGPLINRGFNQAQNALMADRVAIHGLGNMGFLKSINAAKSSIPISMGLSNSAWIKPLIKHGPIPNFVKDLYDVPMHDLEQEVIDLSSSSHEIEEYLKRIDKYIESIHVKTIEFLENKSLPSKVKYDVANFIINLFASIILAVVVYNMQTKDAIKSQLQIEDKITGLEHKIEQFEKAEQEYDQEHFDSLYTAILLANNKTYYTDDKTLIFKTSRCKIIIDSIPAGAIVEVSKLKSKKARKYITYSTNDNTTLASGWVDVKYLTKQKIKRKKSERSAFKKVNSKH